MHVQKSAVMHGHIRNNHSMFVKNKLYGRAVGECIISSRPLLPLLSKQLNYLIPEKCDLSVVFLLIYLSSKLIYEHEKFLPLNFYGNALRDALVALNFLSGYGWCMCVSFCKASN